MVIDTDAVKIEKRALERAVEDAVAAFQRATSLEVSSLYVRQIRTVSGDRVPRFVAVRASVDLEL